MAASAFIAVRGIEYTLGLTADEAALRIDLQQADGGHIWSATFDSHCACRPPATPALPGRRLAGGGCPAGQALTARAAAPYP